MLKFLARRFGFLAQAARETFEGRLNEEGPFQGNEDNTMWLVAGLGNPGSQYEGNRHNIGFMAVDAIAGKYGFPPFRAKFKALISDGKIGNERVLLVKPQTFMNLSGESVQEASHFYKILPNHVLVLHDELDIAPATLKIKTGGGHAGHNGLRSIDACLGTPNYKRLRLGIGHPGDRGAVSHHVLSDFAKAEQPVVEELCERVAQHFELILNGRDSLFLTRIAPQPEKQKKEKPENGI